MLANPIPLKIDLAIRGVRLDNEVRERADLFRVARDYGTRRIEVVLPQDVSVSVPIDDRPTQTSPYILRADGDHFHITMPDRDTPVRVVPQPLFYGKRTSAGLPMWHVGTVYAGYLAINPAIACGVTPLGVPCRFCDAGVLTADRRDPLSVEDVIETVSAALSEGAAEFVSFHIGYMEGEDAGVHFLEPYVTAIKNHFDTLVAVQLQPPRTNRWIDRAYAMGVDALSYSIEIHDPDLRRRYRGRRPDVVGRERYFDALGYAATIFPSGTVWSDLIVGLEPPDSTIAGIDRLVQMGVLPVLSIFRPLEGNPLGDHALQLNDAVTPVFTHLFDAVRRARINMNWIRDLSFAVTPLEARFFAGDEWRTGPSLTPLYRSRLGTMAARNLARMRRRLRVRKVSDSFDASHL